MKTGVIRRIDDLGRIVIPKEMREILKIETGDPLEFYVENERICITKYSPGDAVEVVRCKDCKYCITLKDGGSQCERIDGLLMTKPNDYCSYGERRETNERE